MPIHTITQYKTSGGSYDLWIMKLHWTEFIQKTINSINELVRVWRESTWSILKVHCKLEEVETLPPRTDGNHPKSTVWSECEERDGESVCTNVQKLCNGFGEQDGATCVAFPKHGYPLLAPISLPLSLSVMPVVQHKLKPAYKRVLMPLLPVPNRFRFYAWI